MKLGLIIKETRKSKGLRQITLSKEVGITQAYLSGIETGKKNASNDVLEKISNILEVPLSVMYWRSIELSDVPENKQKLFKFLIPSVNNLIDQIF